MTTINSTEKTKFQKSRDVVGWLSLAITVGAIAFSVATPEARCFFNLSNDCNLIFIEITVRTEDNELLEGVKIKYESSKDKNFVDSQRTDNEGELKIKIPKNGVVKITISKNGYNSITDTITPGLNFTPLRAYQLRKEVNKNIYSENSSTSGKTFSLQKEQESVKEEEPVLPPRFGTTPPLEKESEQFLKDEPLPPPSITSPKEIVEIYHKAINDRNFDLVWEQLAESFRRSDVAGTREEHNKWLDQVSKVDVLDISDEKRDIEKVLIYVRVNYHMKRGTVVYHYIEYSLFLDTNKGRWSINGRRTIDKFPV